MPLVKSGLQSQLQSNFGAPGATAAACAAQWASAFGAYATSVIPASAAVAGAQTALQGALTTAFGAPNSQAAIDAAFTAAAVAIGGSMAPAFVAVPPPAPVGFAGAVLAAPYPSTHAAAATKISDAIDAWMKIGTATPSGGGSPVNWS